MPRGKFCLLRFYVSLPLLTLLLALTGCGTKLHAPVSEALYGLGGSFNPQNNLLVTAIIDPSTGGFSGSFVGSTPSSLYLFGIVAVDGQFLYCLLRSLGKSWLFARSLYSRGHSPGRGALSLGFMPAFLATIPYTHFLIANEYK
jgi:hypothetical protein